MKRKAEEMDGEDEVQRPLKKPHTAWQHYLMQFAKEKGTHMQGLTVSVKISTICFPVKSQDGATAVTQKASEFYRSLSASDKAALHEESAAQREPMTRAEIKKRAEKIGKKIQQLVCMHDEV